MDARPTSLVRQPVGTMRTPLAWRNLSHHKPTLLVSSTAVAFAVLIMFMEIGFLNGLYDSQTALLNALRADLVMVSRGLHILNTHETFPRSRLEQVAGLDGVHNVAPVYIEDRLSDLRNPSDGTTRTIRVLGIEMPDRVFDDATLTRLTSRLRDPMTVLYDRRSRPFFGLQDERMTTELARRRVTVAGTFVLGPDYYYDGNVLVSTDTFFTLFPHQTRSQVALGLVHLDGRVSPDVVLRQIEATIGPDVDVLTKAAIIARERAKWQQATPAGYVFTMGVAVGFVIGVFICYQILYTDIADHLRQLAMLRALGYRDGQIVRLVLRQATLLGMLGFAPAVALAFGLYAMLTALTGIVTNLTPARVALVFALTLGMSLVSGLLAVRKALTADPADLF
jgi:putative ABC transport system permease protein